MQNIKQNVIFSGGFYYAIHQVQIYRPWYGCGHTPLEFRRKDAPSSQRTHDRWHRGLYPCVEENALEWIG